MDLVTATDLAQPDQSSLSAAQARSYPAAGPPGSAPPLPAAGDVAPGTGLVTRSGAAPSAAESPFGDDPSACASMLGGILAISPSTTASAAIPAASPSRR